MTSPTPLDMPETLHRFDVYCGVKKLVIPLWEITCQETGRLWWKRKAYSASNGLMSITGMDEQMASYFRAENKLNAAHPTPLERV